MSFTSSPTRRDATNKTHRDCNIHRHTHASVDIFWAENSALLLLLLLYLEREFCNFNLIFASSLSRRANSDKSPPLSVQPFARERKRESAKQRALSESRIFSGQSSAFSQEAVAPLFCWKISQFASIALLTLSLRSCCCFFFLSNGGTWNLRPVSLAVFAVI